MLFALVIIFGSSACPEFVTNPEFTTELSTYQLTIKHDPVLGINFRHPRKITCTTRTNVGICLIFFCASLIISSGKVCVKTNPVPSVDTKNSSEFRKTNTTTALSSKSSQSSLIHNFKWDNNSSQPDKSEDGASIRSPWDSFFALNGCFLPARPTFNNDNINTIADDFTDFFTLDLR